MARYSGDGDACTFDVFARSTKIHTGDLNIDKTQYLPKRDIEMIPLYVDQTLVTSILRHSGARRGKVRPPGQGQTGTALVA